MTPLEIRKADFKRSVRGFNPEDVQSLLVSASETLEEVLRENLELKQQVAGLKERVKSYESMEKTLNDTLLMAQKASDSTRQASEREAELIVAKAEVQAEKILEEARAELHLLKNEIEMLGHEKNAFLVKMRSLVASQWKLLQEETETGRGLGSVKETVEEQEQAEPQAEENREVGKVKAGESVAGAEMRGEEEELKEIGDVGEFSKKLGKILRGEEAAGVEGAEVEEAEPPMAAGQSSAGEGEDSGENLFWSEEEPTEGTATTERGEEIKPEEFWDGEESGETEREKKNRK